MTMLKIRKQELGTFSVARHSTKDVSGWPFLPCLSAAPWLPMVFPLAPAASRTRHVRSTKTILPHRCQESPRWRSVASSAQMTNIVHTSRILDRQAFPSAISVFCCPRVQRFTHARIASQKIGGAAQPVETMWKVSWEKMLLNFLLTSQRSWTARKDATTTLTASSTLTTTDPIQTTLSFASSSHTWRNPSRLAVTAARELPAAQWTPSVGS